VLLFGHGKKTHLFATNKKLTPHLIKINVHTKNKIKNTQSFNHPTKSTQQPSVAATHCPPSASRRRRPPPSPATFRRKKKKKKIRPLGVAAIHPYGQGREIRPPLVALFVSGEAKKNPANPKKIPASLQNRF
jgi:hypothetical protein